LRVSHFSECTRSKASIPEARQWILVLRHAQDSRSTGGARCGIALFGEFCFVSSFDANTVN